MSNAHTPVPVDDQYCGRPPLALIAGPTASGKSDLAVRLALASERKGQRGVVINADSAQVYADLAVLSARPTPDDMRGVEHRLFGTWDAQQACSAADWADAARAEVKRVHAEGCLPILVGGTGLYIRTLLEGIAPVPEIDAGVRQEVRALETPQAHAALLTEDPQRAAILSPNDRTRILRALEVVRATGRPLADWQAEKVGGIGSLVTLRPLILVPERSALYARCDARFAAMLRGGGIEEVRALLARELDPALPAMRAIGVAEVAGYLRGEWSIEDAERSGARATRNYAKRQYTWLRHQPPDDWPRLSPDNITRDDLLERILL